MCAIDLRTGTHSSACLPSSVVAVAGSRPSCGVRSDDSPHFAADTAVRDPSELRPGHLVAVETLGSRQVYADRWMAVQEDSIRREDGSEGIYTVVDSPDIALVIPADGDRFHLVEQYRYPVGARRWSSVRNRRPGAATATRPR